MNQRFCHYYMSHCTTKPTESPFRPAKTRISLGIHPVWSEFSLSAWRKFVSFSTDKVHSEDSDQTGQMPRLSWVFAGCTGHCVGFIMCRLNYDIIHKWCGSFPITFEPGHEKLCLMPYANNKVADQPAHLRSLISTFVVRCLDSIISLDSMAEISRL